MDWEGKLKSFLKEEKIAHWKLYDASNRKYLSASEDGRLEYSGSSWNADKMFWTTSGHGCIENKATGGRPTLNFTVECGPLYMYVNVELSGMVLTIDDSNGLTVSDINPRASVPSSWKLGWGPDGRLKNVGHGGSVGFEYGSGWYNVGSRDGNARFRSLAHNYCLYEFAEHLGDVILK